VTTYHIEDTPNNGRSNGTKQQATMDDQDLNILLRNLNGTTEALVTTAQLSNKRYFQEWTEGRL
jgi:hypothetical protein